MKQPLVPRTCRWCGKVHADECAVGVPGYWHLRCLRLAREWANKERPKGWEALTYQQKRKWVLKQRRAQVAMGVLEA